MKKTALVMLMVVICAAPVFAQGPFNDVPTDHWAYDAVNQLQKDGIVIGYPDGTFGGKRAMSRYEFAVAIARVIPMLEKEGPKGFVTNAELQKNLADFAKKSDLPDISKLATKADVDALKKLVDEFRDEIAALGVDVDALKRDVCALGARVDALEAEVRRVRWTGDVNVFGIAESHRSGSVEAFDLDEREIPLESTLGRTVGVVRDFDLNVVGRVSDLTTANATINYGNYLNYIRYVDDYIDGVRPTIKDDYQDGKYFVDGFFPYYLYIATSFGKGSLTVGRFPLQFTPYTLKKIDVDSYTSILKTDDGNYPVDGAHLAMKLGGVDLSLFAVKNDLNDYLRNGLTGQPRTAIYGSGLGNPIHQVGGYSVGGLDAPITQTAGIRAVFGTPWKGNIGATFYQSWAADNYGIAYDQARVFGADLAIPFGNNYNLTASWTESQALASDGTSLADIDDDNTAWDGKVTAGFGKLGVGAGYKRIERNFAAAGAWDKIGRWTNPANVKGPYADLTYPVGRNLKLLVAGEFLKAIDNAGVFNADDEITNAEFGIKYGISANNSLDLGYEWVKYNPDGSGDDQLETYLTIGWAHQLSPNTGFKVGYQFINYDAGNGTGILPYGSSDYRAGLGVIQFGVTF